MDGGSTANATRLSATRARGASTRSTAAFRRREPMLRARPRTHFTGSDGIAQRARSYNRSGRNPVSLRRTACSDARASLAARSRRGAAAPTRVHRTLTCRTYFSRAEQALDVDDLLVAQSLLGRGRESLTGRLPPRASGEDRFSAGVDRGSASARGTSRRTTSRWRGTRSSGRYARAACRCRSRGSRP
jgi:hypothetical protein